MLTMARAVAGAARVAGAMATPSLAGARSYSTPPALWSLGRLNHVAIAVPDLQAATAMYRDLLGATVSGEQVALRELIKTNPIPMQ